MGISKNLTSPRQHCMKSDKRNSEIAAPPGATTSSPRFQTWVRDCETTKNPTRDDGSGRALPFLEQNFSNEALVVNRRQKFTNRFLLLNFLMLSFLLSACLHAPQIRDRRVAVLKFESAQPNPKTHAITQWLTTELANYPRVAV